MDPFSPEIDEHILRDLNPWWERPHGVRPVPPAYRRRHVPGILAALGRPRSLIHVLRGPRQVHFYRDDSVPGNRRSPLEEVDFVVEAPDGSALPVEVKFRGRVDREDWAGVRSFIRRHGARWGALIMRDTFRWEAQERVLLVPLMDFLLAF
jgi:hypothetical protein